MFAGLEYSAQPRRGWTAMFSVTLQAAIVIAGLMIPLLHIQGLPDALVPRRIFVPMLGGYAAARPERASTESAGAPDTPPLVVNTSRFRFRPVEHLPIGSSSTQAPSVGSVIGAGPGVPDSILSDAAPPVPRPARMAHPPRVSAMMEGNLLHRVEPQYPPLAKAAGIQGTVVIKAIISRGGTIEKLQVQGGHPLLVIAALRAVRQWKYRPYYLNSEPIEVETEITVNFLLNR
jgi:periplasmic protein TonB